MRFAMLALGLLPAAALGMEALEISERRPGSEESWIALTIVLGSLFAALFLNHRAPAVRVMGTLLAASGCLAIAAWFFFFVLGTGFLENPKPNQTPMDSAKPALLWLQGVAALISGLGLVFVAFRQSRARVELDLGSENDADRYGRVSRVLHWTIAIMFIAMIPMGIFASIIPEGTPYRLEYYVVHKTIGVILFALVIARILWNRRSPRPGLDAALQPLERKLAHGAHMALYFMMIAVPVTGFVMTSFHGAPTFFFAWELQPLWGFSETGTIAWGVLHKYLLPYLIYVILGAHVLGAMKHQFIDRHGNAFSRMVS
jgi:cytochrome b561